MRRTPWKIGRDGGCRRDRRRSRRPGGGDLPGARRALGGAVREGVGARRPRRDDRHGGVPLQPRSARALRGRPRHRRPARARRRVHRRQAERVGRASPSRAAPSTPCRAASSRWSPPACFGLPAKLETARLLAGFGRIDPQPLARVTMREWIDANVRHPEVRELVGGAGARGDLQQRSRAHERRRRDRAGAGRARRRRALPRRRLADAGRRAARRGRGGGRAHRRRRRAPPRSSATADGWRVQLADGTAIDAGAVVLAGRRPTRRPRCCAAREQPTACGAGPRRRFRSRAACLDLALSRLPQPRATFALGIDRPLYLSVHSAYADARPAGQRRHPRRQVSRQRRQRSARRRARARSAARSDPAGLARARRAAALPARHDGGERAADGGRAAACAGRPGPAVPGSERPLRRRRLGRPRGHARRRQPGERQAGGDDDRAARRRARRARPRDVDGSRSQATRSARAAPATDD